MSLLPKDFRTYLVKVMNRELMEIEGPPSLTTISSLIKENAKHLCLEEIKNMIKRLLRSWTHLVIVLLTWTKTYVAT